MASINSIQVTLSRLLQDYLVDLCYEYLPPSADIEIDGLVCLADGKDVTKQLVLKVRRNLDSTSHGKVHRAPDTSSHGKHRNASLQRRESLEHEHHDRYQSKEELPFKDQMPPNLHHLLLSQQSYNMTLDHLRQQSSGFKPVNLNKQGSYSSDSPQNLSLKDNKSSSSLPPLSALANSVEKAQYGGYSGKPTAMQGNMANPPQKQVVSLLYQQMMEASPKNSSTPMWKASKSESPKPAPLDLASPAAADKKVKNGGDETENDEDSGPYDEQKEMLCKVCSETVFGGLAALQNHTYEAHKRYVCKTCYSTFSLRCNLRRHERLHEGLKPYSCEYCDKTFSRSTDLRMHMQKHGGATSKATDNVISCDKCSKSFTNVQNLRWHMYKVHKSQEELWACTICEQLFSDKDEYHQHRESHTASLNQYQQPSKRPKMESEMNGFDNSHDGIRDDSSAMREEYDMELQAIDDEARCLKQDGDDSNTELSNLSEEDMMRNGKPNTDPSFLAIKQALASGRGSQSILEKKAAQNNGNSSSRNKRKRKGNPIKHVVNGNESDEEVYDMTAVNNDSMNAETVIPSAPSPVPSTSSDMDPLAQSYNSDILASSSMSHFSRISEQDHTDHLQTLSNLSKVHSPLLIEPKFDHASALSLPKSSELLYSPRCMTPLSQSSSSFNNNLDDISGKFTPEYKYDAETPSPLPQVDDGDDDKEYKCSYDGCGELFQGFRAYENHFVGIHSRYPCKLCKQTFSGKNNRTRHMRNHNRAKIYPCPDCGKYFSRPDSMREHRYIHTASYQEDKCRRCGEEFQRKSLLLAHLKTCFRSARTKNGSIDESPYMLKIESKIEANAGVKLENLSASFYESPKSGNEAVCNGMKDDSVSNRYGDEQNGSLVSVGQVDAANFPEATKIASIHLNAAAIPTLNENNNETLIKMNEFQNKEVNTAYTDDAENDCTPENLSKVKDTDIEDEASGNLIIDTTDPGSTEQIAV